MASLLCLLFRRSSSRPCDHLSRGLPLSPPSWTPNSLHARVSLFRYIDQNLFASITFTKSGRPKRWRTTSFLVILCYPLPSGPYTFLSILISRHSNNSLPLIGRDLVSLPYNTKVAQLTETEKFWHPINDSRLANPVQAHFSLTLTSSDT